LASASRTIESSAICWESVSDSTSPLSCSSGSIPVRAVNDSTRPRSSSPSEADSSGDQAPQLGVERDELGRQVVEPTERPLSVRMAFEHRRQLRAERRQVLGEQMHVRLGPVVQVEAQPREPPLGGGGLHRGCGRVARRLVRGHGRHSPAGAGPGSVSC
jgi:hypothetical protein